MHSKSASLKIALKNELKISELKNCTKNQPPKFPQNRVSTAQPRPNRGWAVETRLNRPTAVERLNRGSTALTAFSRLEPSQPRLRTAKFKILGLN